MSEIKYAFLLVSLIILSSCSKSPPADASAIIRVTTGNLQQPVRVETEEAVFGSYDFAVFADHALGISKLWGVSEDQAVAKITSSISVQAGNSPDLFIVKVHGLDHQLAVKIVNELTKHYCSITTEISNGGQPQEEHVSIVEAAK